MTSMNKKDQKATKSHNSVKLSDKPPLQTNNKQESSNRQAKPAGIVKLSSDSSEVDDSESSEGQESNDAHLLENLMGKGQQVPDESSSSDEEDEDINLDPEYKQFIEKYGHLDFYLLNFLPKIKSKSELLDIRKKQQDQITLSRSN